MQATIYLGDKPVNLRSSAATPLIFKMQFHRDYFSALLSLYNGFKSMVNVKSEDKEGKDEDVKIDMEKLDPDKFDMSVLWDFVWALAKNADHTIPEPIAFFSQFESLDLEEVVPQIQELLMASMQTAKKSTVSTSLMS